MNEAIDYEALADQIAQRLATAPPREDVIWNAEQCAKYIGVGYRTFREKIAVKSSFPEPACDDGFKDGRWYMIEVIEWVRMHLNKK